MNTPKVLIIGDSISVGYTAPVRKILDGKVEVHRPYTNCESTLEGLERLEEWLAAGSWDIIHFNWGLHDLKHLVPGGNEMVDPATPGCRQKVPIDEYRQNLAALVDKLRETGAKLIWCTTTPVPEGAHGRIPGDAARYNAIAAEIMNPLEIATDDLYRFALPRLGDIQEPQNVHFTDEGSELLAGEVARSILAVVETDA